jgi:hypothetical protein
MAMLREELLLSIPEAELALLERTALDWNPGDPIQRYTVGMPPGTWGWVDVTLADIGCQEFCSGMVLHVVCPTQSGTCQIDVILMRNLPGGGQEVKTVHYAKLCGAGYLAEFGSGWSLTISQDATEF